MGNTDDGGPPLSEKEYEALKAKAEEAKKNELFVYWRIGDLDCVCIGPASPCVCGHRYRDHAWFETETKRVSCRMRGCRCRCYEYIPVRGSRTLYCTCKHSSDMHDTATRRCTKCIKCDGFHTPMRCACGQPASKHQTVIENVGKEKKLTILLETREDRSRKAGH